MVKSAHFFWAKTINRALATCFLGLAVIAPFCFHYGYHRVFPLRGEWVDQTVGQILSEKYGDKVVVKDTEIVSWRDIRCQTVKIYAKDSMLLVSANSGRIVLKNPSLSINHDFITEIELSGVSLSKRYFENTKGIKPWIHLMRRPIHMKNLLLSISQGNKSTTVRVLKCKSNDIILSGSMIFNDKGVLKDDLFVSMSPLKMLWMMI